MSVDTDAEATTTTMMMHVNVLTSSTTSPCRVNCVTQEPPERDEIRLCLTPPTAETLTASVVPVPPLTLA